jgi:hypothetical protein
VLRIVCVVRRGRPDIDRHQATRHNMSSNGLSELNGSVVAGEDDAVAGCHGEVVTSSGEGFEPKALRPRDEVWRQAQTNLMPELTHPRAPARSPAARPRASEYTHVSPSVAARRGTRPHRRRAAQSIYCKPPRVGSRVPSCACSSAARKACQRAQPAQTGQRLPASPAGAWRVRPRCRRVHSTCARA